MCNDNHDTNSGGRAAYYGAQQGQAQPGNPAAGAPQGGQTRRFDEQPADAAAPGGDPRWAQGPGGPPPYYQPQGQHSPGRGGYRGGMGFSVPGLWLLLPLVLVLALHGLTVGAVLAPIASIHLLWPLLIVGAFFVLRRRHGFGRW